jgi:hypothetical protein
MRDRLSRAVEVWIPGGDRENVRMAVADLMLTAIGAAQHRQIFGLTCDADLLDKLVEMVERQVASLQQPA